MSPHIVLDPHFACVGGAFIVSIFTLFWLAENVGYARKKYDVKYPKMYDDSKPVFNCYQRAHQNALETYTMFVVLLFLSGMQYPLISAVAGIVWCVGRIFYAIGYYSGDPDKRQKWPIPIVTPLYIFGSLLVLLGGSISFLFHVSNAMDCIREYLSR